MKVSDYIVEFLVKQGVDTIFGYQGSSISHTIDSIEKNKSVKYIQMCHEQAAAFAANGYAMTKNSAGVAIACSGPGATNLITGIANAYYDSNACIFITGQVSTSGIRKNKTLRQLGFQETDIVSIVSPITKYAITVLEAENISYHMEKAVYLMNEGRKGPVVIDIPHDIQCQNIDINNIRHFHEKCKVGIKHENRVGKSIELLMNAKRPLILLGGGARQLKESKEFSDFCKKSNIPIVTSYRGKDICDNSINNYIGVIGVYGNRYANWAVKYCDVLVIIGSRIDGRQTGDDINGFAAEAKVIYVDIDEAELKEKPDRYIKILYDAKKYMLELNEGWGEYDLDTAWVDCLKEWKDRYKHYEEYLEGGVNPNKLVYKITTKSARSRIVTADVGQNQVWVNASAVLNDSDMLIQSSGLGAMGFSLPAAVGAYYANKAEEIICITGDGGFQMNLQELQTIAYNNIPIKIFIMNNRSLGLIRDYQDKALHGIHVGSVNGFGSPNYSKLAESYGIDFYQINEEKESELFNIIMNNKLGCIVEVLVSETSTCYPEPTYKSTIDNQSPILSDKTRQKVEREAHGREKI